MAALRHPDAWDALEATVRTGRAPRPIRAAIVAAHPDDEIMGAAALLRRLSLAAAPIDLIHVTDGAPANGVDAQRRGFRSASAYARARRLELARAVEAAQITPRGFVCLGVPDQQAAHTLPQLVEALADRLRRRPVDVVLSHAFEGGHPDHDASAFAVHAAAALLQPDVAAPAVVEFTSYHWSGHALRIGEFLPRSGPAGARLALTSPERSIKQQARDCFSSQAETLAAFPLATERFRVAPRYRFGRRPHEGRLLYEHFPWGLTGDAWVAEARRALQDMGFDPDVCL